MRRKMKIKEVLVEKMKIIYLIFLCLIISAINAAGQNKAVPFIEMNSGALLGGVENGKWLDAKTIVRQMPDETSYKLFRLNSDSNSIEINMPKPMDEGVPCEGFYSIANRKNAGFGVAVGKSAGWNPVPGIPQPIDLNNAVYKKAVSDVLRAKGIISPKIILTKAFRIDLDGDGKEEVLIEATSYGENMQPNAKRGDYSVVLLRKIIGGKVQNIIVSGEFITKNVKFGAPGKYELSAVADLNGDGKMELVIFASYYEGIWTETYEINGGKAIRVKTLDSSCGV